MYVGLRRWNWNLGLRRWNLCKYNLECNNEIKHQILEITEEKQLVMYNDFVKKINVDDIKNLIKNLLYYIYVEILSL